MEWKWNRPVTLNILRDCLCPSAAASRLHLLNGPVCGEPSRDFIMSIKNLQFIINAPGQFARPGGRVEERRLFIVQLRIIEWYYRGMHSLTLWMIWLNRVHHSHSVASISQRRRRMRSVSISGSIIWNGSDLNVWLTHRTREIGLDIEIAN